MVIVCVVVTTLSQPEVLQRHEPSAGANRRQAFALSTSHGVAIL